jgi:quinoprotein glucose dehydrogenase
VIEVGKTRDRAGNSTYSAQRNESLHGPNGLPLMQPPYSRITAIDLNTGKHMWMAPTGTGPVNHPALATLGPLSSLGSGGRFFVLATPTSLLVAAEHPQWIAGGGQDYDIDAERYLWAYDLEDGRVIARVPLPGNATGNPMTYSVDGRQFIAIPTNSPGGPAEIMAFALP